VFYFPFAFLFLIPCFIALYKLRSRRIIINILRALFCFLIVLAVSRPGLKTDSYGGVIIVVADRSESMPDDSRERQIEIIRQIVSEKKENEQIGVIGFDSNVFIEKMPDSSSGFSDFTGLYNKSGSSLYKAVKLAGSLIPDNRNGRILILSDGRTTGTDPFNILMQNDISVPIDYYVIQDVINYDLSIQEINMPDFTESGEAFQFSASVYSPYSSEIFYTLTRNGVEISTGNMILDSGINRIYFRDRVIKPGNAVYKLKVTDVKMPDSVMENNEAKSVLSVRGVKPILYLGNSNSNLVKLAKLGGILLECREPSEIDWSLNTLAGYRAIVLENIPAQDIGYKGLLSINRFVKEAGGGLLITGGRQSYGRGGYYDSPLAEIFPVSMELKQEHRKYTNSVVVALDRSGSMTESVGGGLTKIDLANKGTASVIELLSDYDNFGLIAVDTAPFTIVPFQKTGTERSGLFDKVFSVSSEGGGIYIYEALTAAFDMIKNADTAVKHIILFADASDSENPGAYEVLISQIRKEGITVSVIGLGTENDIDARLLVNIADLGGGQIYFTNEPKELPMLFAQDAMTMFAETFIEELTEISYADEISLIMDISDPYVKPLGGYNPCYLKPEASLGLFTDDEEKLPVLAFWQAGNGRCIAFTGEVDGPYSGPFAESAGDFYLSALRWINIDNSNNQELYAYSTNEGDSVSVRLELLPERLENPFSSNPNLIKITETGTEIKSEIIPLRWLDRNTMGTETNLDENGINHFYVQADNITIQCASYTIPYSVEFRLEEDKSRGTKIMEKLADFTGGIQRLDTCGIFNDIEKTNIFVYLSPFIAFIAMLVFFAEIYIRKIGFGWVKTNPLVKKLLSRKKKESKKESKKEKDYAFNKKEEESVLGALKNVKKKQ
jgi:Mg-chelatase subunit ChlD